MPSTAVNLITLDGTPANTYIIRVIKLHMVKIMQHTMQKFCTLKLFENE
jgi:hypothetical protein